MAPILETFRLVRDCVARDADELASFGAVVAFATIAAVLFWAGCKYSMRLWNRSFRMTLFHHAVCVTAGLMGFSFIVTFHSLRHLEEVAASTVDEWARQLQADQEWQNDVLDRSIFESIDAIDPQTTPAVVALRRADGNPKYRTYWSPGSEQEDIRAMSQATAREVTSDFTRRHGLLAWVLWPSDAEAEADAYGPIYDCGYHRVVHQKLLYHYKEAFDTTAATVKEHLEAKLPRVTFLSRLALVAAFFTVQFSAFSVVGWSGYRALRMRIRMPAAPLIRPI